MRETAKEALVGAVSAVLYRLQHDSSAATPCSYEKAKKLYHSSNQQQLREGISSFDLARPQLRKSEQTSTTAPGKVFDRRDELAAHHKSN
jgi:hypothetical protein